MENNFNKINIEEMENNLRFYETTNIQLKSRVMNLSQQGFDPHLDFL